jgi:rhamnosyltransferase
MDSGSTDGSLEMLRQFDVRIDRIPPQEFDFGKSRELGYKLVCGRYLVALSKESVPASEDWLQ